MGNFISLNVEVRWNERNNPMKKVNLPKHVKDKIDQVFNWSLLGNAPKSKFQRKVFVFYYIVVEKYALISQL